MSAETTPELHKLIRLAISDPGAFLPRGRETRDGEEIYELITHWGARAVREALNRHVWLVPRIAHDQLARCGPRIYRTDKSEWITTEEEDAGPSRIRQLAAQMLAAADALEQLQALDQTEEATDAG